MGYICQVFGEYQYCEDPEFSLFETSSEIAKLILNEFETTNKSIETLFALRDKYNCWCVCLQNIWPDYRKDYNFGGNDTQLYISGKNIYYFNKPMCIKYDNSPILDFLINNNILKVINITHAFKDGPFSCLEYARNLPSFAFNIKSNINFITFIYDLTVANCVVDGEFAQIYNGILKIGNVKYKVNNQINIPEY